MSLSYFRALVGQLEGVVRDVHLLLAQQLPVVAVRRTVPRVELVGRAQALRAVIDVVVGEIGRTAHAALASVVDPRRAGLLDLVHRLVDQEHGALERCGREEARHVHAQQVVLRLVEVRVENPPLFRGDPVVVTVGAHREAVVLALDSTSHVAGQRGSRSPPGRSSGSGTVHTRHRPRTRNPAGRSSWPST